MDMEVYVKNGVVVEVVVVVILVDKYSAHVHVDFLFDID
jgi:hypothetical protein